MTASALLILVALTPGVTALLVTVIQGRQRRAEKREDWARQDAVAERTAAVAEQAAEAARLLLERQDAVAAQAAEAAALLLEENKRVHEIARRTNEKLNVIHKLVNSGMTAQMQTSLDGLHRELVMMRQTAAARPSPELNAAIVATKTKIDELTAALRDRADTDAAIRADG